MEVVVRALSLGGDFWHQGLESWPGRPSEWEWWWDVGGTVEAAVVFPCMVVVKYQWWRHRGHSG